MGPGGQPLDRGQIACRVFGRHQHSRRRPGQRQGATQPPVGEVGQPGVDAILPAARRHLGLRLRVIGLDHNDPGPARQPVPEPLGLPGQPLSLGVVETAGEQLLHEVAAQAALHLGRCALLGELQREDRRAVLQRPPPAILVEHLVGHGRDQKAQQLGPRPHRRHVELTRGPSAGEPHLTCTRPVESGRDGQPGRQLLTLIADSAHPEAIARVKAGAAARQGRDRFEDGRDAGPVQGEPGEALVDLMRDPDLGELALEPPLQLHPLQDPGDLGRDRAQEVDVRAVVALLSALHVENADQPGPGLDRNREHRSESLLVYACDPLEARLLGDVAHEEGLALLRDPAGDAFTHVHVGPADHPLVEAVGGGQDQLFAVRRDQIERADVGLHRQGGLTDDQLDQVVRLLGRGGSQGQPLQELQLADREREVRRLEWRPHAATVPRFASCRTRARIIKSRRLICALGLKAAS